MNFRSFINESNKNMEDIRKTISGLPKSHAELVKGYKFIFQPDNTMKGDKGHVGLIDTEKKHIILAAPYNYGREWVLLHEIGHLIWAKMVSKKQKEEWTKIVRKTKNKAKDTDEELFSMAYANHFAKNKIVIHNHEEWDKFVKQFV